MAQLLSQRRLPPPLSFAIRSANKNIVCSPCLFSLPLSLSLSPLLGIRFEVRQWDYIVRYFRDRFKSATFLDKRLELNEGLGVTRTNNTAKMEAKMEEETNQGEG